MASTYDQKDSILEVAALIRTAAETVGRAAELLSHWQKDDLEMESLLGAINDLLRRNALVGRLAAEGDFGAAANESRILTLFCDSVAGLRPIGSLKAMLVEKALRAKYRRKT